jgi:hypothetical protein
MNSVKKPKKRMTFRGSKLGLMQVECSLVLHSWQSKHLFYGSWKPGKYGFIQFIKTINTLFQGFREGDPYAEFFLFKLDDLLVETKEKLKAIEAQLKAHLDELKGVEVKIYETNESFRREMVFRYPPSYMGGFLLGDFDYIIRLSLTLKKFGVYLDKSEFDSRALHQMFRVLYEFPKKWISTGVTRKDIFEETPTALRAEKIMGQVPKAILEQAITLPYLTKPAENTSTKT